MCVCRYVCVCVHSVFVCVCMCVQCVRVCVYRCVCLCVLMTVCGQRVLTIAQLPGDVVLLPGAVLEQAEGRGGVPGLVWVPLETVEAQDQVQASTLGKVVEFV